MDCGDSDFCGNQSLHRFDGSFIPFVKDPLFDFLVPEKARLTKNAQMLACSRLANAQFPRDEYSANSILHQIAIQLGRKMLARIFQPLQNLKPPCAGKSPERKFHVIHLTIS